MGAGRPGRFWLRRDVLGACAVCAFGGIVMVISLFGAVAKMIRGSGGVKTCS